VKNVSLWEPRDFFKEYKDNGKPWILAGMGPSFSNIYRYPLHDYNILGINKVVREIKVDVALIIDWYIVDKVHASLYTNCTWIASPYYPHFGCRPHPMFKLGQCIQRNKLRDKFLGFNLSTFPLKQTDSPVVEAKYFSAEAALNIIALLGCKEVYAIGIDGGKDRAKEYADHGPCDPRGFDLQWETIAKTIKQYGLTYKNLDSSELNPKLKEKLWQT
jgi:hypothetical protein